MPRPSRKLRPPRRLPAPGRGSPPVAGLGYETIQYDMFKNGSQIGSAGWDRIDRGIYDAQAANGIRQGIGSIEGQDYYVTW